MKTTVFITSLIFSISIFSEVMVFDIKIKHQEGQSTRTSSSTIKTKLDSKFSIDREDLKSDFLAKKYVQGSLPIEVQGEAIVLTGEVFKKRNDFSKLIAKLEMVAELNKEAVYTLESEGESLYISLTPKKPNN